ncbi:hypothetical protein WDW86_12540 [Bdellovibrionota bacterium FG-2]
MCKFALGLMLTAFAIGPLALAEEPPMSAATSAEAKDVTKGLLREETYSLKPEAGAIAFTDASGQKTSRFALGIVGEMNLLPLVDKTVHAWYVGPSTGFVYPHMGDTDANFVGGNSINPTGRASANLVIVPTDVKVGYAFTEYLRVSVRGGGNLIYRSVPSSLALGSGSDTSGTLWKYFPNVGGDLDIAIGKNIALNLRPDVTITPGNSLFTGTVGLGIFMG